MRRHLNAFTVSFALHLLVAAALVWMSAAEVRQSSSLSASVVRHGGLPDRPADAELTKADGREARKSAGHRLQLPDDTGSEQIEIPNFTFDFSKVRRRATTLFPFVTEGLSLEVVRAIVERTERKSQPNPYASRESSASMPPLAMSGAAIQALVDKAWSRRERWPRFQTIADLTKRYSPNDGQLPAVVRAYLRQNLLQPYIESHVRDPRLWVMLGIAADHSDFIDFITRYAAEHPSTKTTTELLFMLDDMAQGSRDSLLTLLSIDTEHELWWTAYTNKDAHRLVEAVQSYYRKKLHDRGIDSTEGVQLHYDRVRLSILHAIVAETPRGYRADDARFLIGWIYWTHGRIEDAMRWWREMSIDGDNAYVGSARAIREAIGHTDWQQINRKDIQRILDAERSRWTEFWWNRLRQFGYSFSSF